MTTRKELVAALQLRYGSATFGDRIRILDEFVALTGYHRKHAIRLLREKPCAAKETRERNRLYDEAVRQALTVLWEAADRVCGKRLKALIPKLVDAMERHGHLDLDPVIKAKLLEVSAATIDRMLANARLHIDGQRKRRKGVGSANRSDYLTVTTSVAYNAAATCPLFEQTVSDAFYGDAEMIEFFQRVVGYSLMGNPKEHVIVIPYGSGSNGKSTILNAILAVLGGHAKCTSASTFLTEGRGFSGNASGPNEALLRLRGSRFVSMSEPDEGSQLREGLIKSVTGGDMINARGVHAKHLVEFPPSWVTFMATNHRPIVKGIDYAIWRRLLLIPFTRNFSTDAAIPKDPDRAEKLKAEYEGILRWCVDGALAYQRNGLRAPESVKAAHVDYKEAMDLLGDWLADEWEDDPNGYTTTEELWTSWKTHGEKFGTIEMVRTVNALSRRLVDRGYTSVKKVPGTGKRGFQGIKRRSVEGRDFLD